MLIIAVEKENDRITLRLTGRLGGPEMRELARQWEQAVPAHPRHPITLDLSGIDAVDEAGKRFITDVHLQGDRLIAGASTEAIVGEVRSNGAVVGA
jgi:ABC-type transporter Mla MlaB component